MSKSQSWKEIFNNIDASQITKAKEWIDGKEKRYVPQCVTLIDININIYRLTTCLILNILEYVSGLYSNDEIFSNNISVTLSTHAIIDVNGSTQNLDDETTWHTQL